MAETGLQPDAAQVEIFRDAEVVFNHAVQLVDIVADKEAFLAQGEEDALVVATDEIAIEDRGYGAARLRPIFARPSAWRVLDGAIALVMWGIALKLIFVA